VVSAAAARTAGTAGGSFGARHKGRDAGASAFMTGTEGTAGVSAFVAAATVGGLPAATRSSRFGSIFGDDVVSSVPPANPIVTAANTVPTPAKKDVVLKAMSVSTF
jgi:hypothetical protein